MLELEILELSRVKDVTKERDFHYCQLLQVTLRHFLPWPSSEKVSFHLCLLFSTREKDSFLLSFLFLVLSLRAKKSCHSCWSVMRFTSETNSNFKCSRELTNNSNNNNNSRSSSNNKNNCSSEQNKSVSNKDTGFSNLNLNLNIKRQSSSCNSCYSKNVIQKIACKLTFFPSFIPFLSNNTSTAWSTCPPLFFTSSHAPKNAKHQNQQLKPTHQPGQNEKHHPFDHHLLRTTTNISSADHLDGSTQCLASAEGESWGSMWQKFHFAWHIRRVRKSSFSLQPQPRSSVTHTHTHKLKKLARSHWVQVVRIIWSWKM